jgi:hypothetical protein
MIFLMPFFLFEVKNDTGVKVEEVCYVEDNEGPFGSLPPDENLVLLGIIGLADSPLPKVFFFSFFFG